MDYNKTEFSSICINKCFSNELNVNISSAEKNCYDRCIYKVLDTLEFGNKFFKYFEYKLNESNN